MIAKSNPLKLNKLQSRTLVLAQIIAKQPGGGIADPDTGAVRLLQIPHAHGDHVHVGPFVVSARDASGFSNPSVWVALARKGLAINDDPSAPTLTLQGMEYDTGLSDRFVSESDH